MTYCTYPRCKCVVSTSTSQPEPVCPLGREKGPSEAQLAALYRFAKANGRSWRRKLMDDWFNGRSEGELQQLRNSHGPRWLLQFKL